MSRVIVTGGSGRLGVSVVRVLDALGHDVISVDRSHRADLSVRQVQHDLADAGATARLFASIAPDAVVHLAAVSVPFSYPDPQIYATNTTLAWNVLQATVATQADRLLMASSPTVVGYGAPTGWAPAYLPIDEDHPIAPWNGYSLSKQAIEALVRMAVRRDGDRMRYGVFRPCYIIAPEEWGGAPTQQGHTVLDRLDDPELSAVALFNYVDARDAADFIAAWLERAHAVPNGQCYFVSAADSLVREPVGDALRRLVPQAAGAAEGLSDTGAIFSSARAHADLGWRPTRSWRTELHDGAEGTRA